MAIHWDVWHLRQMSLGELAAAADALQSATDCTCEHCAERRAIAAGDDGVDEVCALADPAHPFADCRVQIEDQVRAMVDPMPEHAAAVLYLYLYSLGWREDRARAVRRKAFGGD